MKKISVLTATSDRKNSLCRYIESVISADDFANIELIFLINGENLITESLLEQYSQKHNNIRFIKSDKQSRGAARNTLIKYA
ncbi:MAG: glycosyltransferase, partial [Candidatus Omnitrophota bacterium]